MTGGGGGAPWGAGAAPRGGCQERALPRARRPIRDRPLDRHGRHAPGANQRGAPGEGRALGVGARAAAHARVPGGPSWPAQPERKGRDVTITLLADVIRVGVAAAAVAFLAAGGG